eukprot:433388-Amphidinium_carterae.1
MARADIVWAMPPSPQHSHCLACEYLLHLALWHRRAVPICEDSCESESGKPAKFWFQHCRVVSFGIAVEQLAVSSYC